MPKTILERITINNILAFMVVGSYSGLWLFIMVLGVTQAVADGTSILLTILATIEQFQTVMTTMTIIVVIVVQYHFRTNPPKVE